MKTLKEATQLAVVSMHEIYPDVEVEDVLVEEVEIDNEKAYWFITLSLPVPTEEVAAIDRMLLASKRRKYKTFKIDAETGEMLSMKIRELQS